MGQPHARALVLLLFAAASTGLIYLSSLWTQALKDRLGLSQDNIETIALCCYCGGLIGWVPGKVADTLGPRRAIVFGGLGQALVLCGFYAVASGLVPTSRPMIPLCVFSFLQYCTSGCTVAAVFSALSRLYAEQRGVVVGIGKCWVGMFGAIVTQSYKGFMPENTDGRALVFILVVAAASVSLTSTSAFLLEPDKIAAPHPGPPSPERKALILTVIVATIASTTTAALASLKGAASYALTSGILVLLLAPSLSLLLPPDAEEGGGDAAALRKAPTGGLTTREMVARPAFWLLIYTTVTTIGGGLIVSTNGAQMAEAAGCGTSGAATVVTLFSGAQALARLNGGASTDALRARGLPIQAMLIFAAAAMAAAYAIMAASTPAALHVGVVFAGFGFGTVWPLMVVLVRDLWGDAHMGSNYMIFDGTSSALGSLVFAKLLVASYYDAHATTADDDAAAQVCTGRACFPYGLVAGLNLTALVTACLLTFGPLVPIPFIASAPRAPEAAPVSRARAEVESAAPPELGSPTPFV